MSDSISGGWLYKEKGAVCGPVSAAALIDKLFSGALDGETSIAPEFGEWRRLAEVPEFEAPLARAVKARAEEKARLEKQRVQRRLAIGRAVILASAALVVGPCGFVGGHVLAVAKPWEDKTDWSSKRPDLVTLSVKPVPQLGPTTGAGDGAGGEAKSGDAVASADSGKSGSGKRTGKQPKLAYGKGEKHEEKVAAATSGSPPPAGKEEPKDDIPSTGGEAAEYNSAGLPRTLSQKQIMTVLGTQKTGIVNCLAAEAKTNPNMPPVVTIEFVITQKGTAAEFQLGERDLRNTPLYECLKSKIMACKWPAFFGENKTVTLPFNIKRK